MSSGLFWISSNGKGRHRAFPVAGPNVWPHGVVAPAAGVVKEIKVAVGESVDADALLAVIE